MFKYFKRNFLREPEALESWTVGLLDCWTVGPVDLWTVGLFYCWTVGLLDCWTVALLNISFEKISKINLRASGV